MVMKSFKWWGQSGKPNDENMEGQPYHAIMIRLSNGVVKVVHHKD